MSDKNLGLMILSFPKMIEAAVNGDLHSSIKKLECSWSLFKKTVVIEYKDEE